MRPEPVQIGLFGDLPDGLPSLAGLPAREQARLLAAHEVRHCPRKSELRFLAGLGAQFGPVTPQQNLRLARIVDRLRTGHIHER